MAKEAATDTAGPKPVPMPGMAMPFGMRPERTFALVIGLPALALYVAFTALVIFVLSMMANEINRLDDERTGQTVKAASRWFLQNLADATADEGTWTEAYLNSVVTYNPAWLDSTWGTTAREGLSYDNVLVTDQAGNIVFGENAVGPIEGNIVVRFTTAASMLYELDQAILLQGDGAVVSHFATDSSGVVGLTAISIHRSGPSELTVPAEKRRILWLARHLTPAVLADFAETFNIAPLKLEAAPSDERLAIDLLDTTGAVAGTLTWLPERPGDGAFAHAMIVALSVLFVIGVMLLTGLILLRRSVFSMATRIAASFHAASHDASTGLANQFGFVETIQGQLDRLPAPKAMAVAELGLDGFDATRELHGPDLAEEFVRKVGRVLLGVVGFDATLARNGESSFSIGATGDAAETVVKRLAVSATDAVSQAVDLEGVKIEPRISVGIAKGINTTVAEQVQTARIAMHTARRAGEGTPVVYDVADNSERQARKGLALHLRRAIREGEEFELEYQPIFDLRAETMIGVEALLRWHRADGAMGPAEFMPLAEAHGLTGELGRLALRRAVEEIRPFKGLMLGVNVATSQFEDPEFVEQLRGILAETKFPVRRLQIEIDQSLLAGKHRASGIIDDLRNSGICVALDDFVVGQSSIGYLRQFSLDRVKLAKSLISGIDTDRTKLALVETTMTVARSANIAITATGVERKEEASKLLKLGCTEFQGFLLARPLSLDALTALILSGSKEPERLQAS